MLGLPSKINLANSNSEVTLDRAQIDDDSMDIEGITARAINMKFKPFPTNCQVVSISFNIIDTPLSRAYMTFFRCPGPHVRGVS